MKHVTMLAYDAQDVRKTGGECISQVAAPGLSQKPSIGHKPVPVLALREGGAHEVSCLLTRGLPFRLRAAVHDGLDDRPLAILQRRLRTDARVAEEWPILISPAPTSCATVPGMTAAASTTTTVPFTRGVVCL